MSGQHPDIERRTRIGGAMVISLALVSACGTSSPASDATPSTEPAAATSAVSTTTEPAATSPVESATTTPPPTTAVPATTLPGEPIGTRDGLFLRAGWPYVTSNFGVPFSFTAPTDEVLGRWRVLFDTSKYTILTLSQTAKESPEVEREEPGVAFFALPASTSGDEFVDLWTGYAATEEDFTVEVSDGEFLGESVQVVTGDYVLADDRVGALFLRLADDLSMPVAPGARRYVMYLVPVENEIVVIRLNAHELDFDLNVTLVNEIVATIEFE